MDSKYKYFHKILEFLYHDWKDNNEQERLVGSVRIAEKTNISIAKIHELQHILINNGDIVSSNNDGQSMMSIQQNGISAFIDKKYLNEGKKEFWDNIFNWARIVIPLGALIFSIWNFVENNSLTKRLEKIEKNQTKTE